MSGGHAFGWGVLGGLVLCGIAWGAPAWLVVLAGIAIAAAVGRLAGARSTGRPAVDGAWAGAIASGIAWIGVVGSDVAIGASGALITAAESRAWTDPAMGDQLLTRYVLEPTVALPLAFWVWFAGGTAIGALSASSVARAGATVERRLPGSFAPAALLSTSVVGLTIVSSALSALEYSFRAAAPDLPFDAMVASQMGSALLAMTLAAGWAGGSIGIRLRHATYGVRASGALMTAVGLPFFVLPWLMNPMVASVSLVPLVIGVLAAIAGYRRGTGAEPLPSGSEGASEVLHTGLLAVCLIFGAMGTTTGLALSLLVVTHIDPIMSQDWAHVVPIDRYLADLRWIHASWGFAAVLAAWAALSALVFPSIALQRRFGGTRVRATGRAAVPDLDAPDRATRLLRETTPATPEILGAHHRTKIGVAEG